MWLFGGGVVGVVAVVMFALLFEVFLLSLPFILLLFFAGAAVGFAVGFAVVVDVTLRRSLLQADTMELTKPKLENPEARPGIYNL